VKTVQICLPQFARARALTEEDRFLCLQSLLGEGSFRENSLSFLWSSSSGWLWPDCCSGGREADIGVSSEGRTEQCARAVILSLRLSSLKSYLVRINKFLLAFKGASSIHQEEAKPLADCCLTRLCDMCGIRIQGANYHCPKCDICICSGCGLKMMSKGDYPLRCPMCSAKLH